MRTPDASREVHIYTAPHQPATRYRDPYAHMIFRRSPFALVPTSCCDKRRRARHCTVQMFYDHVPFWCRPGHGCRIPKPGRRRVTALRLLREFKRGLSMLGLARKYGMPRARVSERRRRAMRPG